MLTPRMRPQVRKSSRNAARDPNVDRFMIADMAVPREESYTLSYVITHMPRDMVHEVAKLQGVELRDALVRNKLVPDWVTLPAGDDRAKNFDFKVIRDNKDGSYRAEVITDIGQYVNMVQKGILRRDVKGPEALFDNRVYSDIEGHFKAPGGKLKLQSPHGVVNGEWPGFEAMSQADRPTALDTVREGIRPSGSYAETNTAGQGVTAESYRY